MEHERLRRPGVRARSIAVAVGLALGAVAGCSSDDLAAPATTTSSATSTEVTAAGVVEAAQVRPSWEPRAVPPGNVEPGSTPSLRGLDQSTRWFVGSAALDDEWQWVLDHPPTGFTAGAQASPGDPNGTSSRSIRFDDDEDPSAGLVYTMAPLGHGTVIRVDGQVAGVR